LATIYRSTGVNRCERGSFQLASQTPFPAGQRAKAVANLNGCIAPKSFANPNGSTRTRWSERHAVSWCPCADEGVPVLGPDSVSWQHEHERPASACAPDVRLNVRAERAIKTSAQRSTMEAVRLGAFAVVERTVIQERSANQFIF